MLEPRGDGTQGQPAAVEPGDFIPHEGDGGDEADSGRGHVRLCGCTFDFKAHQVVGDSDAPQLLPDTVGRATANRLLPREQVRLDLVVGDLGLPALVVQLDQFLGPGYSFGSVSDVSSVQRGCPFTWGSGSLALPHCRGRPGWSTSTTTSSSSVPSFSTTE